MKSLFFFAMASMLFLSCSKESGFVVNGTAAGFDEGAKVYIQKLSQNNRLTPLDTVNIVNNSFKLVLPYSGSSEIHVLTTSQTNNRLLLIEEDERIIVTLYKDSLANSLVEGGHENELFYKYITNNRVRNAEKQKLAAKLTQSRRESDGIMVSELSEHLKALDLKTKEEREALVKNHPNSLVSVIVISDLINGKAIDLATSDELFEGLSDKIKKAPMGKSIAQFIAQQKSQQIAAKLADVGNKAPEFSAQTPEGKELALSQTLGKYTIIDFWASWCRPCRAENPNVVRVYNKYHEKGLNIVSVSLDRQGHDNRWKKAIADDEMDWYHVSNLNFWNDPIAKSYGVRSIPATFLLDENGIIIAKNLRGRALETKMNELLGES